MQITSTAKPCVCAAYSACTHVRTHSRVWLKEQDSLGGNVRLVLSECYRITELHKAISQNVRLLGCVCKPCKNCDNCCCSTKLVAPTKNPWKKEKGTTLFVTLQHRINPLESIKRLPGPTDPIKSKRRNNHLCVLGT